MNQEIYIGRFAPSPSGPLHFGSLLAATASYLQAKHNNGQWRVRIDDIDPPREVKGSAKEILETLERYKFEWDQDPLYQSTRIQAYRNALEALSKKELIYACSCSRKDLQDDPQKSALGTRYPGTCADKKLDIKNTEYNLRIRLPNKNIGFNDEHFGMQTHNLYKETGDFVIHRKFDLPSYALATTVDDAYQKVSEVVRGEDLLAFTPMQIYLCDALRIPVPSFFHIPIIANQQGQKLSKQTKAQAISRENCGEELIRALNHLGQNTPNNLVNQSLSDIWDWAIEHWDSKKIPLTKKILYNG